MSIEILKNKIVQTPRLCVRRRVKMSRKIIDGESALEGLVAAFPKKKLKNLYSRIERLIIEKEL